MKNIFLLLAIIISTIAFSQVGIGTETPKATLDVVGNPAVATSLDGVIAPRVTRLQLASKNYGTDQNGAIIFVTTLDGTAVGEVVDVSEVGYYRYDAVLDKWVSMGGAKAQAKFFYMPSISVDVSTVATGNTLDLYTLYKNQFDNPAVKSTNAPADVPFFVAATDLYYYVTSYDTNAMTITSIDDNGIMTYNVSGAGSTPCSLLNIVFVYK